MKRHLAKRVTSSVCLLALMGSAFAGHTGVMGTAHTKGKLYLGVFGGAGSTQETNVAQYGTAFYTEAQGGPLAVNAFGHKHSQSAGFLGLQLGYQAKDRSLGANTPWTLAPAIELEGYSFSNKTVSGELINNTARLPEHDFVVSYPVSRTVFLTNAVLNFNNPCVLVHPYIGFGIGAALVRISGADASQISPPEVGVNHYNGNDSDTSPTFAGQIKAGLSYDINKCVSVFAEYRWLYMSSTHFIFGSTVYTGHPETSPWQLKVDPQRSNLGAIGIRFNM